MNLSDKIMCLRKKEGWSQEELAMRLNVSRQSVSKWESQVSTPEMDKILQLSELFNVSTDYLLKDNHKVELNEEMKDDTIHPKYVNYDEAKNYIKTIKIESKRISYGVFLCILGVIGLILFAGTSSDKVFLSSEEFQMAIGLASMFICIIIAVTLFIVSSAKTEEYKYLTLSPLSLEKRVKEEITDEYKAFKPRYNLTITISVILLISSVIPLIIGGIMGSADFILIMFVVLLLTITMFATTALTRVSLLSKGYKTLLNQVNFTKEAIEKKQREDSISTIYWVIIVAIYLAWSFLTNDWQITWIVWPVAGVLSSIIPEAIKLKK